MTKTVLKTGNMTAARRARLFGCPICGTDSIQTATEGKIPALARLEIDSLPRKRAYSAYTAGDDPRQAPTSGVALAVTAVLAAET